MRRLAAEIASEPLEEAIVETKNTAVETVEPVVAEVTEEPSSETKIAAEPTINYDYNAFAEKPLYNVKKRPDSLSALSYQETGKTNQYSSLNQKKLNSQKASAANANSAQSIVRPVKTQVESPKATEATSSVSIPVKAGNFQIIVGAFSDAKNARNYVSQLQSQGFNAYISESSSLNRVAIGSFPSADAASESLTKIKREVAAGAWLNAL